MEGFAERVEARFEKISKQFSELDSMTVDMLRTYALICVQIDDLNEKIAREGYFVATEKGHKENPALNTVHKLNADKARYFAPLKRVMNKQAEQHEDEPDYFIGL